MSEDFDDDDLADLRVALPNHAFASEERLWAEPRGDHQFTLCSSPRYAYGLHFGDVVIATLEDDGVLEIRRVARPGGHRTFRVTFLRSALPRVRAPMLDDLAELGVACEGCTSGPVAIDVPPDVDIEPVRAQLEAWQRDGLVQYESAAPRVRGSFDDAEDEQAEASIQRMIADTYEAPPYS